MKKAKVKIEGMHCASCATNVEKSLKKINGIRSVSVNAIFGNAVVDSDDDVTEENIRSAIKNAGYIPKEIKFS